MFEQLDVAGTFQGKFALADWTRTGRLHGAELDTVLEENGRILSSCDSIRYWFRLVLIWKSGGETIRSHLKSIFQRCVQVRCWKPMDVLSCWQRKSLPGHQRWDARLCHTNPDIFSSHRFTFRVIPCRVQIRQIFTSGRIDLLISIVWFGPPGVTAGYVTEPPC